MSHSVRFLTMAIAGWAAVRAITLGLDPQQQALAANIDRDNPEAAPAASPGSASQETANMTPAQPYGWPPQAYDGYPYPPPYPYAAWPAPVQPQRPQPVIVRIEQPHSTALAAPPPWGTAAMPGYVYGSGAPFDVQPSTPTLLAPPPPLTATPPLGTKNASWRDRVSAYTWLHYRTDAAAGSAPPLAPVGTLGGSQVGTRLLYRLAPRLEASARYASAIGDVRGSEAALGVRYRPFAGVPFAVTAERRQRVEGVGRSGFSVFAEGGYYGHKLPLGFTGDGNLQAGVIGLTSRDWFADAQMTAKRPLFDKLSGGAGIWTAAQPGLNRVDIGPRISYPLPKGFRLDADYRVNVAGNAAPGDGPAITLSGGL